MPDLNAGAGTLVRDGLFISINVHADPETAHLAAPFDEAQARLVGAKNAHTSADTAAIKASALAAARYRPVRETLGALGTGLFGHFNSRTVKGYVRVFPMSPTDLLALPNDKRDKALENVRLAALSPETPKELAQKVKAYDVALRASQAADKEEKAAAKALAESIAAEKEVADAWQTAVRVLKSALEQIFPRDAKKVASYLPNRAKKRTAKAAVPV